MQAFARFPFALAALLAALTLAALTLATPALAGDGKVQAGDLVLTDAWTRQGPPAAKVGGGYVTITNGGTVEDRLVGGSAPHAARIEIHSMSVTDGVMRMAPVEGGLAIPPGGTVELKPGGYHVMFMGVRDAPKEGDTLPVTLTFEKAGEVVVEMPVAAIGATERPVR